MPSFEFAITGQKACMLAAGIILAVVCGIGVGIVLWMFVWAAQPPLTGRYMKHPEFLGGSRTRRRPGGRRCSDDGSPEEVSVGVA
jgi:hypothetical protein